MVTKLDDYISEIGLVETQDPENEKPLYRQSGFDEISSFADLDTKVGIALRKVRTKKKLSRVEVAALVGLTEQVYGRYERNASKMHVSRLIHLSEVLDISPVELLSFAAPHLWGKTQEEADARVRLIGLIEGLPFDTIKSMLVLLESFSALDGRQGP